MRTGQDIDVNSKGRGEGKQGCIHNRTVRAVRIKGIGSRYKALIVTILG